MIEVSLTDVLLFAWAAIATVYLFKYKEEALMHKYVIHKMLTDEKIRGELIASYENNFKGMTPR
jgi:hypothetical protein